MPIERIKLADFGNLELLAKQVVEGFITGLHKSPFHGFSVEFAEHRLYNSGESTRHIDWKLFARTERMYTKKYEEETNLRSLFVLDASSSMYFSEATLRNLNFDIRNCKFDGVASKTKGCCRNIFLYRASRLCFRNQIIPAPSSRAL